MFSFDIILDWAVEVPLYQRKDALILSSLRVNPDTIVPDITAYYTWLNNLYLLEVK